MNKAANESYQLISSQTYTSLMSVVFSLYHYWIFFTGNFKGLWVWVNSHEHLLYIRYLNGLLQLYKTFAKI